MSRWTGSAPRSGRLDQIVGEVLADVSRSRAAALIRDGNVTVDDVVVTRPAARFRAGVHLTVVVPPPLPSGAVAEDLPLHIVYQDADLVIVNKAAGMVVHPAPGHASGTLVNGLLHHIGDLSGIGGVQRPGIVHRLDRGTSGLMVVAKHDRAHQHLAAQFADHSARRRYLALCLATPEAAQGRVESRLARHPRDRIRYASTLQEDHGKRAVTHWWLRQSARGLGLMEFELETGRTHQIRVHATESGFPLVGDPMYRQRRCTPASWLRGLVPPDRPMLHAWRLTLTHPTTEERVVFEAELPDDFQAVLSEAGMSPPQDEGFALD